MGPKQPGIHSGSSARWGHFKLPGWGQNYLLKTATGLYLRMWRVCGLPPVDSTGAGEHYEELEGSGIDTAEAGLRRRLRQPWRVLPPADEAP